MFLLLIDIGTQQEKNTVIEKQILRKASRARLKVLSQIQRDLDSKQICEEIRESLTLFSPHSRLTIASFAATDLEPDLASLHSLVPQHRFCYPKCEENGVMHFFNVQSYASMELSKYRIHAPNPLQHEKVKTEEIDIILCPASAYTIQGKRLGKGGGYYDRFLKNLNAGQIQIWGICFPSQIVDSLPCESHDIEVMKVITGSTSS